MFTYPCGVTNLNFAGMAAKFGWLTVIISPILLPFLFIWSNLLAFPVWLLGFNYDFKTEPKCLLLFSFKYDEGDVYWNKFYKNPAVLGHSPSSWQCYLDFDKSIDLKKTGGKGIFIERFFFILNWFDIEIDQNRNKMVCTPNAFTWVRGRVEMHFVKDENGQDKGHHVLFCFPYDGLQRFNPFFWITFVFIGIAIALYNLDAFKEENGIKAAKYNPRSYLSKLMEEKEYERIKSGEFLPDPDEVDETSPLV